MKQLKNYKLGLVLATVVIIMFLVVSLFFLNTNYYKTSLFLNAYVLPPVFVILTLMALLYYKKQKGYLRFKDGFTFCYLNQLIGGALSLTFILVYMNVISQETRDIFNFQFYNTQYEEALNELEISDLSEFQPKDDEEKDQKALLENIKHLRDIKDNIFSFFNNGNHILLMLVFGMNLFYIINSVFLSMFFKTSKQLLEPNA